MDRVLCKRDGGREDEMNWNWFKRKCDGCNKLMGDESGNICAACRKVMNENACKRGIEAADKMIAARERDRRERIDLIKQALREFEQER